MCGARVWSTRLAVCLKLISHARRRRRYVTSQQNICSLSSRLTENGAGDGQHVVSADICSSSAAAVNTTVD